MHYTLPKSLEGFYQESGRAGRDGKKSISLLYYSIDEREKMKFLIAHNKDKDDKRTDNQQKAFEQMIQYCESAECRRKQILKYFGEKPM